MFLYNSDLLAFLTTQFKVASLNLLLLYIIDQVWSGIFVLKGFYLKLIERSFIS